MFRFANTEYFYLLLLIPLLIVIYTLARLARKKKMSKYGKLDIINNLMPDVSKYKPIIKFILALVAIFFITIAIVRPQSGAKEETVKVQGIEVMMVLDVSNSMMAEDMAPNRLSKAKMILSRTIDKLDDDKVGLIVFAGEAYTQLPITSDFVSAKIFLNDINTNMVPTQGTAIAEAIHTATKSFSPDEKSQKSIVVITDAENHEGDAVAAATEAAESGITVNVVGIGNTTGAPIPIQGGYMKDEEGNVVMTALNEADAKKIAQVGKGIYVRADDTNVAVKAINDELKSKNKTELDKKVVTQYDEQFPIFAWIALILLVIDVFVLDRKISWLKNINFFTKDK